MCRFNLLLTFVLMICFSNFTFARSAQTTQANRVRKLTRLRKQQSGQVRATPAATPIQTPAPQAQEPALAPVKSAAHEESQGSLDEKIEVQPRSGFESQVGVGYEFFEDAVKINDPSGDEEGVGNFVGLAFRYSATWIKNRWYVPVVVSLGWGKATAGGFASVTLPERLWSQPSIELSALYRFTSRFAVGPGVMAYHRSVNWESPDDPTITSTSKSKTGFGPQLVARLNFGDRWTLMQTAALLEAKQHSLWQWTLQYRL